MGEDRPRADEATDGPGGGQASLRMDLPASMAGFTVPPCHVHLKFIAMGDGTGLLALTEPGRCGAIARWLEPYRPTAVRIGPGLAPKFLQAEFRVLPDPWSHLLDSLHVRHIELSPDGTASVFIRGPIGEVARFIQAVQPGQDDVRFRRTVPTTEPVRLTGRQQEALSKAVALGYFEIPHKVDLRTLARHMGLTHGAVSELLRRAEAAIVTSYVDSLTEARWDDAIGKLEKDPGKLRASSSRALPQGLDPLVGTEAGHASREG